MLAKPAFVYSCRLISIAFLFMISACVPDQDWTAYAGEQSLYQIDGTIGVGRIDMFVTPLHPLTTDDMERRVDGHQSESTPTVEASLRPIPILPSLAFGSGGNPTGTNYIAIVQGVRVEEGGWDKARCGIVPTSGVCVQIQMRNMYPDSRVRRPHLELTRLTPTPPTTIVTFDSNTSGNS